MSVATYAVSSTVYQDDEEEMTCVLITAAVSEAAGGLSAEDRKKYAEQVTMQFWQAIGGNADEFEGLSSDSD